MKFSSFILHPSPLRKGFSLPEIMFAIMILGIGFIMVAAMFPVAIQQAKTNKESISASLVAQRAMRCLEQAGMNRTTAGPSVMAETGGVYTFEDNIVNPAAAAWPSNFWYAVQGEMIEASDPRFAWAALYARSATGGVSAPTASVVVFVTAAQQSTHYGAYTDLGPIPGSPQALCNLQPKLIRVGNNAGSGRPERIILSAAVAADFGGTMPAYYTALGAQGATPAVGEGAFAVLSGDPTASLAGQVVQFTDYDAANDDWGVRLTDQQNVRNWPAGPQVAWVVGRTYDAASNAFVGKVQDIAVYKGVIRTPYNP